MQYLSKAYNYYSGINPATLSGAIDIIVVRHVDEDGEEQLASTPFHVRFGKLQVLRAGEKTVTLRLPNNLPAPHVAPFNMKVGDTGEAFFVVETTEDVPEDLLTSPVVLPSDQPHNQDSSADTPPDFSQQFDEAPTGNIVTQQPFGETEKTVGSLPPQSTNNEASDPSEILKDVEYLDLNADDGDAAQAVQGLADPEPQNGHPSILSPSSIFETASSKLPSIPFVHSTKSSDSKDPTQEQPQSGQHAAKGRKNQLPDAPPNPVATKTEGSTELPARDHKLSQLAEARDRENRTPSGASHEDGLPRIAPGDGEAPHIHYRGDAVLDMAGYHSRQSAEEVLNSPLAGEQIPQRSPSEHSPAEPNDMESISINAFVNDLNSASSRLLESPRPPLQHERVTDSHISTTQKQSDIDAESKSYTASSSLIPERRHERGQSEPPLDVGPSSGRLSHVSGATTLSRSPLASAIYPAASPKKLHPGASAAVMDYAWDWGKLPGASAYPSDVDGADEGYQVQRRTSQPLIGEQTGDMDHQSTARLDLELSSSHIGGPLSPTHFKHVEHDPYLFKFLGPSGKHYLFEMSLVDLGGIKNTEASAVQEASFLQNRISFSRFLEDPEVVNDAHFVVRYNLSYLTWTSGRDLLMALFEYRRALAAVSGVIGHSPTSPSVTMPDGPSQQIAANTGWSRWWRRNQTAALQNQENSASEVAPKADENITKPTTITAEEPAPSMNYAKSLRLSSDQLKQLCLKPGPNTVQFSVTSSYSGLAVCTARIFLWDNTDQIVISDIDGTITKSDALGHVFAAIGRDWTHLGIARLYTDICNNGYKMMYLTSRAIGQADSTREYLKSIAQGDYRLPEGPVIMSPDRLMASLHREVIMRKPELFKMACLRDIQRLFADKAAEAFYAGFGNRITDALSYRSVGVETSKIYTIDSTGIVRTELLQAAGHKGSYLALNDLVNEVFPPVKTKVKPEFTDFNYWRSTIPYVALPDFSPPSPALSARSDTSSRYSVGVLGKIASIGRRSSRPAMNGEPSNDASSRPSSPLIGPSMTPDELSEAEDDGGFEAHSRSSSMPGSFESHGEYMRQAFDARRERDADGEDEIQDEREEEDVDFDDGAIFDDDILAAGEMKNVPF